MPHCLIHITKRSNQMKRTNDYIESTFVNEDIQLQQVRASIIAQQMPAISVSAASGKLLTMLVAMTGAKKVVEIGALGGYSGICLARGFGKQGMLTSLELEESYATLAYTNLCNAGFKKQVSYKIGPALESLTQLAAADERFDFFFIDADKENYENYLEACIKLATPNAVIVIDNVLAAGSVVDDTVVPKRYTTVMKQFNNYVAAHPKLEALLLPIGDGITVARVV